MENLNPTNKINLDKELLNEAEHLLSQYFNETISIIRVEIISKAERRNKLLRLHISSTLHSSEQSTSSLKNFQPHPHQKNIPQTVILKQTLLDSKDKDCPETDLIQRFINDSLGLSFLTTLHTQQQKSSQSYPTLFPLFYGKNSYHLFVLLEDLGHNHLSLVDFLTKKSDRENAPSRDAEEALHVFMKNLSTLHLMTHAHIHDFQEQRLNLYHEHNKKNLLNIKNSNNDKILECVNKTLPPLEKILKKLNIPFTKSIHTAIHNIIKVNLEKGPFTTLTHGDICPDNVFYESNSKTFRFFDFEWCDIRNALLDAAYPRMGMPTCWCAKAIPSTILLALENTYKQNWMTFIDTIQAYDKAYIEACAFWAIKGILLIDDVLENDDIWPSGDIPKDSAWNPHHNCVRPRILSRLSSFTEVWSIYGPHKDLIPFFELVQNIDEKLLILWKDAHPMSLYSVFE